MTTGRHFLLFRSSDDFKLLTSPTMLGDSQKGSWHENRVLVDSWKIIAFPIRVGFGNCFVVRLTCVVLVLFCSITWVSTHIPRGTSIAIQLYMGWCTHPVCTYMCLQAPLIFHMVCKHPEKIWHGERREGKQVTLILSSYLLYNCF